MNALYAFARILSTLSRYAAVAFLFNVCLDSGAQAKSQEEPTAARLLSQAATLATRGQLAEAEPMLESASKLAPHDAQILTELGKVKGRLSETAEAVSCFQRALAEEPTAAEAHLNLALALADNNQLPDALKEVDVALRFEPANGAAHYDRGRILYDLQRFDEAVTEFAAATKRSPRLADAWYYWALIETKRGNAPETSRLLQVVVRMQPQNAHAFTLLGKSLQQQSRLPEAEKAWRDALAIDPNDSEAVYALMLALRRTRSEEWKRLMERFQLLQKQKDESDRLEAQVKDLGNQAVAAMQTQDWNTAAALLGRALEACGQCSLLGDLHKDVGLLDCHRGDLAAAKQELLLAHSLKANDRDTVLALEWVARQEHTVKN